jgi:nucleoside-diphosphate-sugar epimerase
LKTDTILDEDQLEERLTLPSERDVAAASQFEGDVIILGAGGKMGPSLAVRMGRAIQVAGLKHRVIAVVRKDRDSIFRRLSDRVDVLEVDLLNPESFDTLPDAPNVVFMVGRKFGSVGDLPLTWATNAWIVGLAAQRFQRSRIVAFSTGNVYPFVSVDGPGADEHTAVAPVGEYAQSTLARERIFEYFSNVNGTPVLLFRLNYAIDLRYGVLLDICEKVVSGEPIDLTTGFVNVIWQGDANSYCLRSFALCDSPARILNVTGLKKLSVREVAERFGHRFGKTPNFTGTESKSALLSDASGSAELLGAPDISEERLIEMTADWFGAGGVTLGKPTKFERRDGNF